MIDKLHSYGAAKRKILPAVAHWQRHYLNNRVEVSPQPTQMRERNMQRFLSAYGRIHNHFQLRRHLITAEQQRATRDQALRIRRDFAPTTAAM